MRPTNQVERTRVVVESIAYERRNNIELKPKEFKDGVDCVVVRLRWDPDADKTGGFFAMLPEEIRSTGMEHRFYLEAGKYTGVFFNVSQDKLKTLGKLIIYSVEGAKLKSNHAQLTVGIPSKDDRPAKP